MLRICGFFSLSFLLILTAHAQQQPPIEAYGALPDIRYAAISASGRKIAMSEVQNGQSIISIYDLDGAPAIGALVDNIQVRGIDFVGDEFVIIRASEATRMRRVLSKFEYSAAFAFNLKTQKIRQLLKGTKDLYRAQTGLGRIVGYSNKPDSVFMPGYVKVTGSEPRYDLFRVDLNSGRGRTYRKGTMNTTDWFVEPSGEVLAREEYSNARDLYQVIANIDGDNQKIYEVKEASLGPFSLLGVKPGKQAFIVVRSGADEGYDELREMDFQGNISPPILSKTDADIDQVFMTANRVIHGVRYSGAFPTYEFLDRTLNADITALIDAMPGTAVSIIDWSDNWRHLLVKIDGPSTAGSYLHYDRNTGQSVLVGHSRPEIPQQALGEVFAIQYTARDGLKIPAVVTLPPQTDLDTASNLPLIAMPHGGPAAYDAVEFSWMAQYFANRGYVVIQPNFRGSSGYGASFLDAGDGEWGGKMQDDITDGVQAMIKNGVADPKRMCIVGASYGGFAALAGGAFTPGLFSCVIAIGAVSDLPKMLSDQKSRYGRDHWVISYWEQLMANGSANKEKLNRISPVNHADAFQAPVLLIHGRDDTVVPIDQSEIMRDALKRADKAVRLIKLKGEDHWLSESETRLQTLKAVSNFVHENIGG
ncbi:MAG: alpha/beta hydrolase family protein [bacterium]